jgi:hypothetical protein
VAYGLLLALIAKKLPKKFIIFDVFEKYQLIFEPFFCNFLQLFLIEYLNGHILLALNIKKLEFFPFSIFQLRNLFHSIFLIRDSQMHN